jgi:hypothetical protein
MVIEDILSSDEVRSVVDDYRSMCFWFMDRDFRPKDAAGLKIVVENLEHYGDMAAYRRAGRIREWLSQVSSPAY